jgi:hypothetical protein
MKQPSLQDHARRVRMLTLDDQSFLRLPLIDRQTDSDVENKVEASISKKKKRTKVEAALRTVQDSPDLVVLCSCDAPIRS